MFALFTTCLACCHTSPNTKLQGNVITGNMIQYENVSTCSFLQTHVIFSIFSPSDTASASLFLRWSLFLLPAPLRCSPPTAFNKTFFPLLEDFTVSFCIPCAEIINKEEVWAKVSLDHRNGAQFTCLSDVASGCLQIPTDTRAGYTQLMLSRRSRYYYF